MKLYFFLALTFFTVQCLKRDQKNNQKGLVGGITDYRPGANDYGYQVAVSYARINFQNACNLQGYQWVSIVSVQSQVVAGTNYFLNVVVKKENSQKTLKITVWVQPINSSTGVQQVSITRCQQ